MLKQKFLSGYRPRATVSHVVGTGSWPAVISSVTRGKRDGVCAFARLVLTVRRIGDVIQARCRVNVERDHRRPTLARRRTSDYAKF